MSTPKAISGIEKLADALGDKCVVGVGTVLDAATAASAIHAGAEFVVSPTFHPDVVEVTRKLGKISVPGAMSPTEILTAWTTGADVVKIYPATTLGPGYVKDLTGPDAAVTLDAIGRCGRQGNAGDWIKAGRGDAGCGRKFW